MPTYRYILDASAGFGIGQVKLSRLVTYDIDEEESTRCVESMEWTNVHRFHPFRSNEFRLVDGYIGRLPHVGGVDVNSCKVCVTATTNTIGGTPVDCTDALEIASLGISTAMLVSHDPVTVDTGMTGWNNFWQYMIDNGRVSLTAIPTPYNWGHQWDFQGSPYDDCVYINEYSADFFSPDGFLGQNNPTWSNSYFPGPGWYITAGLCTMGTDCLQAGSLAELLEAVSDRSVIIHQGSETGTPTSVCCWTNKGSGVICDQPVYSNCQGIVWTCPQCTGDWRPWCGPQGAGCSPCRVDLGAVIAKDSQFKNVTHGGLQEVTLCLHSDGVSQYWFTATLLVWGWGGIAVGGHNTYADQFQCGNPVWGCGYSRIGIWASSTYRSANFTVAGPLPTVLTLEANSLSLAGGSSGGATGFPPSVYNVFFANMPATLNVTQI